MFQHHRSFLRRFLQALIIFSMMSLSGCEVKVVDKIEPTTLKTRDKIKGISHMDGNLRVWFQKSAAIYYLPLNHPNRKETLKMIEASKRDDSLLCVTYILTSMQIKTIKDCSAPSL